jgi:hypothetical protein
LTENKKPSPPKKKPNPHAYEQEKEEETQPSQQFFIGNNGKNHSSRGNQTQESFTTT